MIEGSAASPSVTVLVAAFDAAGFIARAIESALQQTYPILEVLVVDDCSTDRTVAVVEAMSAVDPRIRLLRLPHNGGPSVARNAGLDAARGEWVAILDADDAFLVERIGRLIAAARDLQADVVADNFAWFDLATAVVGAPGIAESAVRELVPTQRYLEQAMPFTGEADWGLLKPMFRRRFLDAHALRYPTHSRHGEDYLLMISVFLAGARFALVRSLGYLYTDRSSGLSRTRIDYGRMVVDSAALLTDPRIQADPQLTRSMTKRVAAIERLSIAHAVREHLAHGRVGAIGRRALREPPVARELGRHLWQRARSRTRATLKSWLRR